MNADEARSFEYYSERNAAIVNDAFSVCGCEAYESVFTYGRWKAIGKQVQKGEKSIKVQTYVTIFKKDENTGEKVPVGRKPRITPLFCSHQVA